MSSMAQQGATNNGWKLLGDQRLPATVFPFWDYELGESWSWRPVQYNTFKPIDTPSTLSHDYYNYLQAEQRVPNPLITMRGGLSGPDQAALEDDSLNFPDIRSLTHESQTILANYWLSLGQRGMIPRKVAY